MNKRLRKKKDIDAINLAKQLRFNGSTLWISNIKPLPAKWNVDDCNTMCEIDEIKKASRSNEMLLKVCRKCIADRFPLIDYEICEIPYCGKEGWIICFTRKFTVSLESLDFLCLYPKKLAIPLDHDETPYNYGKCKDTFAALSSAIAFAERNYTLQLFPQPHNEKETYL